MEELRRDRERIEESKERVLVGTMGGAVGSLADADRWTEFVSVMAMLAAKLERMAQGVYALQRPEIDEVPSLSPWARWAAAQWLKKRNPQFCDSIRTTWGAL